jgi:hypothetical protein
MKLVSGHTYLRGSNGEVVPYSERLAKASGYEQFVQTEDFVDDMQLPENLRPVAGKRMRVPVSPPVVQETKVTAKPQPKPQMPKPQMPKPVQAKPPVKQTFEDGHMDIRDEMNSDLSALA